MSGRGVVQPVAGNAGGAVLVVAVLLPLLSLGLGCAKKEAGSGDEPGRADLEVESSEATLFFPGPGARLTAETRELALAEEAETRARQVVEALIAGPEREGLYRPLPEGVGVGSVLVAIDGTVFLDLVAADGPEVLAWGSKQELLAVYSLVNTVLANEPRARRVMLLWNGQQRPTFAGHVDVTRPLTRHAGLVAQPAGAG